MPAALPPMTTRQAKRFGKKTAGQFHYTASQMRRADRREELEERRKKEQNKERKKKENKRKREEQEEKERAAKRRLLREGKISEEDILGKVSSSQPRLNTFFKTPATVKRPRSAPVEVRRNEVSDVCDSQEETLVEKDVLPHPDPLDDKDLEYISDHDLLQLVSTQLQPSHPTPPQSFETPNDQDLKKKAGSVTRSWNTNTTIKMLKRKRSPSPESADGRRTEAQTNDEFSSFEVAEDETAELLPLLAGLQSPSRSVLSEMSVANINTRAQEKPDTTSAPPDACGLRSPSQKGADAPNSTQHVLGLMAETNFDHEDDELMWDKENTDPLDTPSKDKGNQSTPMKSSTSAKDRPESSKKPATPGFSKFEDCEEIFDFDFDTGDDDFVDEEVDDATLIAMAATQKPKADILVNAQGSPKKLSPIKDAFVKPAPLEFTPKKNVTAPPLMSVLRSQMTPSKSYRPSKLSESFSSLADEDLLVIADRVEEELSQKQLGKQRQQEQSEMLCVGVMKGRGGRKLPWVVDPLPMPSTQDCLLELAEEVEADGEAEVE